MVPAANRGRRPHCRQSFSVGLAGRQEARCRVHFDLVRNTVYLSKFCGCSTPQLRRVSMPRFNFMAKLKEDAAGHVVAADLGDLDLSFKSGLKDQALLKYTTSMHAGKSSITPLEVPTIWRCH